MKRPKNCLVGIKCRALIPGYALNKSFRTNERRRVKME